MKISLNFKYVNQLNISLINIELFYSLIKSRKESFQLSVIISFKTYLAIFILEVFINMKWQEKEVKFINFINIIF